ncbi:MAG: ABC transporter permease subunit [Peptostreptococcus sp.]|uniref:ABC transporter permease n=1 Tax=Peptostreptococcus sp. TaxID=1262 RepID=UPI002FC6F0C7
MANKKNYKVYLEIFPVMFILLFVLVVGIFGALVQSLGYFPIIGMNDITFRYYTEIFRDSSFIESLLFTLYITTVSSIISVALGILLAKILLSLERGSSQKGRKKLSFDTFYKLPIVVPHIIVALFAITFLSDSGIIARILYKLGLSNSQEIFSNVLFSSNGIGIIVSYVWKEVPYILLTCLAVMRRISSKHEMAAVNLGASKMYAFMKVTLPMLLPTILSTFTIIFSFSFGAYELPMLLGSTVPKTLPIKAFIEYQNPIMSNRPHAMAMNMVIVAFCVLFVILFNYIIKRAILGKSYGE